MQNKILRFFKFVKGLIRLSENLCKDRGMTVFDKFTSNFLG